MKQKFTLFLLLLISIAYGQNYKFVNTITLNIRDGKGTKSAVIGKLHKGDKIEVLSDNQNWTRIKTKEGTEGYVSSKFLTKSKTNIDESSPKKKVRWGKLILLIVLLYIVYKIKNFFNETPENSTTTSNKKTIENNSKSHQTKTFFLTIDNGIVNLRAEKTTMKTPVFNYFDKAVDCDIEDTTSERSRFLVTTTKGEVILCHLKSTRKDIVFKPSVPYGSAHKAKFADSNSYIFVTEKGTFKGYFDSTRKDKLS